MNRWCLILTAGCLLTATAAAESKPARPNIIFILADDLGYGDLGCYGQKKIKTPNLDRLAAEGMRFTQCYAGSTVCAPSRCALMTGLHTGHARVRGNARVPLRPDDMHRGRSSCKTAGYATGLVGKWGLGEAGTHRRAEQARASTTSSATSTRSTPTTTTRTSSGGTTEKVAARRNVGREGRRDQKRAQYSHDLFREEALSSSRRTRPAVLPLPRLHHPARQQRGQAGSGMEVPDRRAVHRTRPGRSRRRTTRP